MQGQRPVYQLHWPDRSTNFFGQLGYQHSENANTVPIEETLEVMTDLSARWKNPLRRSVEETPWGVHRFLEAADQHGLAPVVSIQNPYNLLNRTLEIGLAEMAICENVGLLAYSPLAFGSCQANFCMAHGRPNRELSVGTDSHAATVKLLKGQRLLTWRSRAATDLILRR